MSEPTELETLRMQVDRLIARCAAKDTEFAKQRLILTGRIARLEKELKAATKEGRRAA